MKLWTKTRASVGYIRKESRYQDYDTLFLSKRDDSENRYELGLIYDKETLAAHYIWNF